MDIRPFVHISKDICCVLVRVDVRDNIHVPATSNAHIPIYCLGSGVGPDDPIDKRVWRSVVVGLAFSYQGKWAETHCKIRTREINVLLYETPSRPTENMISCFYPVLVGDRCESSPQLHILLNVHEACGVHRPRSPRC